MRHRSSAILMQLYGRGSVGQSTVRRVLNRVEGGEFYSETLRDIFRHYHRVDVGSYTHGGCFVPYAFGPRTTIGRYSSIARSAFAATRDHPTHLKSMHGFFHNSALGYTDEEGDHSPLEIGSDVWLGHNSIINAGVSTIGHGAVVGAGAVVFKDVPPYAIVVGNPGRVVRYRFDPQTIAALLEERWWEQDVEDLRPALSAFTSPLTTVSEIPG